MKRNEVIVAQCTGSAFVLLVVVTATGLHYHYVGFNWLFVLLLALVLCQCVILYYDFKIALILTDDK